MSAIRLARAATRRDRILKFAGCYHGHVDALLASAGSGHRDARHPRRRPACRPAVAARHDRLPVQRRRRRRRRRRAATARASRAILVEPVAGNMGVVPPEPGFLEALRELCDASGALLVFDEVITGFRVARGGAQERYGVHARPDHPRQDRRRRAAARRVRRPGRADGAARAGRRRLPGRHALREPARDGGGALRAAPAARPGGLRRARADAARGSRRAWPRSAPCSASARC